MGFPLIFLQWLNLATSEFECSWSSSGCDFMMGLGRPQLHAKIEVAGFMYHINIREFVLKNWDERKWGNSKFFEKLTLPLNSLQLWLQKNGWFPLRKTTFHDGKFYFLGRLRVWVKYFWAKVPKSTSLHQNSSYKSFGVCSSSGVLTLCEVEKKARENAHLTFDPQI